MPKLSLLRSDLEKEENGIWENYEIPGCEVKIECLIARIGNRKYNQYVQEQMQEYLEAHPALAAPGQRIPADAIADMQKKAVAKHVLLDWNNVDDDDGKPLPYTWEVGLATLENGEYHDFNNWLHIVAGSKESYRREADTDAVKN